MITKTVGTLFIVVICILLFPVAIAILGGMFGIVIGVFGAIFGVIGGLFGAVFGAFGWIFDGIFDWHWPFGFFNCNFFALAAIVLVVAIIMKSKPRGQ